MYTLLRLRYQQSISDIISLLDEMALMDGRGYRALATPDVYSYTASTASSPSLRAREPLQMQDANGGDASRPGSSDGGNVKVVVRVRKFLQRGQSRAAVAVLLD